MKTVETTEQQIENAGVMATRSRAENAEQVPTSSDSNHMKQSTKGILLVPQPSDDPRDPLVSLNLNIVEVVRSEICHRTGQLSGS